jgi:uncharacterized protein
MKPLIWNPLSLDVLGFAQSQSALSGQWPLQDLTRLSESVVAASLNEPERAAVHWHIQGEMDRDSAPPQANANATKAATKAASPAAVSAARSASPPSLMMVATEARAPKVQRILPSLHVSAQVQLTLQCQCCLAPVSVFVEAQRRFVFVNDENDAELLDEEVPEDCDVLVLTAKLNAQELIEDELLMAQPLVPRHEVCPRPLRVVSKADAEGELKDEPDKPHPFAVLAQLKGRGKVC